MLYAYCLSDDLKSEDVTGAAGVEGAMVRVIEVENIKAVVSDLDARRAELTRQNIAAHEAVIRRALSDVTPLPFRFGCVVTQNELEEYVHNHARSLVERLERVRGAIEMSVKVFWDAEAVKRKVDETCAASASESNPRGPGAAFLESKRRELKRAAVIKALAEEVAGWLAAEIGDAARQSNIEIVPSRAMALRAAHLVARSRLQDYRARLDKARRARTDIRFLTSGPWPPYSFCKLGP
jgi:hypothetical protein